MTKIAAVAPLPRNDKWTYERGLIYEGSQKDTIHAIFVSNKEQIKSEAKPHKFVMKIPTEVAEITMPFIFKDLPLPDVTQK